MIHPGGAKNPAVAVNNPSPEHDFPFIQDVSALADGVYKVEYSAIDAYGLKTTVYRTVTIDSASCAWPSTNSHSVRPQCHNGQVRIAGYIWNGTSVAMQANMITSFGEAGGQTSQPGAGVYFTLDTGLTSIDAGSVKFREYRWLANNQGVSNLVDIPYTGLDCAPPAPVSIDPTPVFTDATCDAPATVEFLDAGATFAASDARDLPKVLTLGEGESVTITAAPQTGFVFTDPATISWTFTATVPSGCTPPVTPGVTPPTTVAPAPPVVPGVSIVTGTKTIVTKAVNNVTTKKVEAVGKPKIAASSGRLSVTGAETLSLAGMGLLFLLGGAFVVRARKASAQR